MGHLRKLLLAIGLTAFSLTHSGSPVLAGGVCGGVTLACENGQSYPLCPIAVSIEGEIVTGQLRVQGRGVHMRLVPMGVGYRYIGRNIWFDGVRSNAILYFGVHRPVACIVERE